MTAIGAIITTVVRDPLFHFAILGTIVFFGIGQSEDEVPPHKTIILSNSQQDELITMFEQRNRRLPKPDELSVLNQQWLDSELLFRLGMELKLNEFDRGVRNLVIARTRELIKSGLKVSPPTDQNLQEFFLTYRNKYGTPAKVKFKHVLVSRDQDAEAVLDRLQQSEKNFYRQIRTEYRTTDDIDLLYGETFTASLFSQPLGSWTLTQSSRGFHVTKVQQILDPKEAQLSEVRSRVELDWIKAQRLRLYQEALTKFRGDFVIQVAEVM